MARASARPAALSSSGLLLCGQVSSPLLTGPLLAFHLALEISVPLQGGRTPHLTLMPSALVARGCSICGQWVPVRGRGPCPESGCGASWVS